MSGSQTTSTRTNSWRNAGHRAIAALALATLVASGCGDDPDTASTVAPTAADPTTTTEPTSPTNSTEGPLTDPDPSEPSDTPDVATGPVPTPLEGWTVLGATDVDAIHIMAPCHMDPPEIHSVRGTMTDYESPDGTLAMSVVVATGDPDDVRQVAATWNGFPDCIDDPDIHVEEWDGPADQTIGFAATTGEGPDAIQQWLSLWVEDGRIVVVTGAGAATEAMIADVSSSLR